MDKCNKSKGGDKKKNLGTLLYVDPVIDLYHCLIGQEKAKKKSSKRNRNKC